jgi:hypothetical protein
MIELVDAPFRWTLEKIMFPRYFFSICVFGLSITASEKNHVNEMRASQTRCILQQCRQVYATILSQADKKEINKNEQPNRDIT